MAAFDHLKVTYFEECSELLDAVYTQLGVIQDGQADEETVHAIFRAIHSIKGGGGAFNFERMVTFAHALETLLDLLRDRRLSLEPDVARLLLRSTDALSDLLDAARTGEDAASGFEDELLQTLRGHAVATEGASSQTAPVRSVSGSSGGGASPIASPVAAPGAATAGPHLYAIRFVPDAGLFRSANEPLLIIRQLKQLGPLRIEADLSRLPDLTEIDPEEAYLAWTFHLQTAAGRPAIEELFEFVVDDCHLSIDVAVDLEPAGATAARPDPNGATSPPIATAARPVAVASPEAGASIGPEAGRQAAPGAPNAATAASIRVDVEKVDRLVNLVGELVINQAMLVQVGAGLPPEMCRGLLSGLETMSQHLRELQEGVMAIRAHPVRSVFARMPRLVREVSSQLGKDVRLVITGEATEIDKTIIEQLADPLTHLLRNALDHGIEPPDDRAAQGKPRQGVIHLSAEHRGGAIVIEISDDGRGIDRAKVQAKARSRGLLAADAVLSDEEVDNLIFLPGFSTADVVSGISGRGVGMDVVKRNIQALGGRINVESRSGIGSRIVLSLPLTLAILDGMVVAVGRESYIIPLTNIIESLRPKADCIHPVVGRGHVFASRAEYVPLIYLHQRFGVRGAVTDASRGIVVIVEVEGRSRVGLVVDELIGQRQVVVKSLEANYGPVQGIGGATILGDGRVALILDVSDLHEAFGRMPSRPPSMTTGSDAAILQ